MKINDTQINYKFSKQDQSDATYNLGDVAN